MRGEAHRGFYEYPCVISFQWLYLGPHRNCSLLKIRWATYALVAVHWTYPCRRAKSTVVSTSIYVTIIPILCCALQKLLSSSKGVTHALAAVHYLPMQESKIHEGRVRELEYELAKARGMHPSGVVLFCFCIALALRGKCICWWYQKEVHLLMALTGNVFAPGGCY